MFKNGYDSDGALGTFYDCIDELDQMFDEEELPGTKTDEVNKSIMGIFCDNLDEVYAEAEPVMIHKEREGGDNNCTGSEVLPPLEECNRTGTQKHIPIE